MRTPLRLAAVTFFGIWIPLSLWRGIAMGRSFRIGSDAQHTAAPLVDAVIQIAFVMLAPALFVALLVFALAAWREERAARNPRASS